MKKRLFIVLLFFIFFSCNESEVGCNCFVSYSKPIEEYKTRFPNIETLKIRYQSDSLEITGYITKPKSISNNKKIPVIIYNRGGNRNFGAITEFEIGYFKYLSSFGFIIMASQYRGNLHS